MNRTTRCRPSDIVKLSAKRMSWLFWIGMANAALSFLALIAQSSTEANSSYLCHHRIRVQFHPTMRSGLPTSFLPQPSRSFCELCVVYSSVHLPKNILSRISSVLMYLLIAMKPYRPCDNENLLSSSSQLDCMHPCTETIASINLGKNLECMLNVYGAKYLPTPCNKKARAFFSHHSNHIEGMRGHSQCVF